jgi:RNA-directed DNA polymerase
LRQKLSQELEHSYIADFSCYPRHDCNIYVRSQAAGERVMSGIRVFLEKTLHLQINLAKSAVARPSERKFLGFSFTAERERRIRIAIESRRRSTARVRELQHRGRGQSLARVIKNVNPLLRGWIAYFQISETPSVLKELDSWDFPDSWYEVGAQCRA